MIVLKDNKILQDVRGWDRAVQFGDGLFETMLVVDGNIRRLQYHVARFESSIRSLKLKVTGDVDHMFRSDLNKLLVNSKINSGIYKILLSRGLSSRGYRIPKPITSLMTAFWTEQSTFSNNSEFNAISEPAFNVMLCKTPASINSRLAGIKHLNRLDSVMAADELKDGYQEGLLLNDLGLVIDGTMSNIFFEDSHGLHTPKLNLSGVAGTMRQCILNFCSQHGISVQVRDIKKEELTHFNSAFMCNAVMGIRPISQLEERSMITGKIVGQLVQSQNRGKLNE